MRFCSWLTGFVSSPATVEIFLTVPCVLPLYQRGMSLSEQVKIRLLPQVWDILLDQLCQWTIPDINPIINRSPEAIALCRKGPMFFIIQDKLQHRRIMDLVPQ